MSIWDEAEKELKTADIWAQADAEVSGGGIQEFGKGLISSTLGVAKGLVGTAAEFSPLFGRQTGVLPRLGITKPTEVALTAKRRIQIAQKPFEKTHKGAAAWAGRVVGEAIPYMATAMAGGIAAGPIGAALVGFSVEGDNAYDDAIRTHATEGQAQTERVIVGSINAAIEAVQIGRLMKFQATGRHSIKGFVALVKKKAYSKMAKEGVKFTGGLLKLSFDEGLEELLQEGVSFAVPANLRGEMPRKPDGSPDLMAIGERLGGAALGGAFAGGILGGAGSVSIDMNIRQKVAQLTQELTPDQRNEVLGGISDQAIEDDPDMTTEEKISAKYILGNIRTEILKEVVPRLNTMDIEVKDIKSLKEVGEDIAKALDIEGKINWSWSNRKTKEVMATHKGPYADGSHRIRLYNRNWAFQTDDRQMELRRAVIHELGHMGAKPVTKQVMTVFPKSAKIEQVDDGVFNITHKGKTVLVSATNIETAKRQFIAFQGERRNIHHNTFKKWVEDNVGILMPEIKRTLGPVMEAHLVQEAERLEEMGLKPEEPAPAVEPEKPAAKEKKRKPYKSQYVAGHEIPKILDMKEKERRKLMKKETGETSMAKMTPSSAQDYIDALHKLAREKGIETGMFPTEREFKKPIVGLTPQLYKAKILGVEFMTQPATIGKQKLDIEFAEQAKQVEKMEQVINRLGGETRRTRASAKLRNKPTKSVAKFADLLNKHEEAPAELSKEETDVFNYFRNLNRSIIAKENEVRKELNMDPIVYKPGYMRHIVDTLALDVIEGRHPIPEEIKYWAEKNATKKIRNPMEFQRKLGDELEEIFSNDVIKATKAMLWTGLKEIHLNKPLKFFEGQMGLHSEVIPDSTRRWAEKFINQMIVGKQTATDSRLDEMVRESGIGKVIDKILRPFGRRISRRPLTRLMSKAGRLQIYGVMGWRPKQLIRNKFQILQNLALYTTKANLKSFLTASKQLKTMMSESLFLKTYKGFEDMREVDKRTLGKWWLAPFQWTAVSNARRAMKVSYWDTLELIEDPRYKKLGWVDPERTYTEKKEFLYPSEKEKLLAEMEFGAGVTQYHYIPMAMPGVFNYKVATPLTRLQSWWMNYFFKFHRESAHRFFKGETREGLKLPWSRRIGWARYLVIGGLVLNTLGYTSSYLFGAAPEAISPLAQLLISMYKYVVVEDEKARVSAKRKFLNALKTFIPGYLAHKDLKALLETEDWKQLLFYKKGIFTEEPAATPTGRRKARRVRPRKARARR